MSDTPPPGPPGGSGFITGPDGTVYQAVPVQPAPGAQQNVAGERHVSAVAGSGSFDRRKGAIILSCAVAAAVAFIVLRPKHHPASQSENPEGMQVHEIARFEPPPPLPAIPASLVIPRPMVLPPPLPLQPLTPSALTGQQPVDPLAKARRANPIVFASGAGAQAGQAAPGTAAGTPGGRGSDPLAANLQATPLAGVSATVLRHQPYLLTEGTVIPCVLQTAMDSTLPGFTTCILPQDVIGKTGITLLDRGSKIVGEFQGGMRQGQSRLFVLWTRAETPGGVIINLDSPAADPLGRAGFDGAIDNHFWERFGGALLLTLVEGGAQAGVALASPSGSTYFNTGNISSASDTALASSINIPPTIRKNQGEMVSIMVARDLDFSTVYQVGPSASSPLALVGTGYR